MAILEESRQTLLTYADVAEAHPNWSQVEVEDYLSIKQDITDTAASEDNVISSEIGIDPRTTALLSTLQAQVGSGNALTSDETGFTVDSDKLSADMDEA
jgi:hypothetical protein